MVNYSIVVSVDFRMQTTSLRRCNQRIILCRQQASLPGYAQHGV